MPDLLRLPLRVADYATRPTRFVVGKLLDLRRSGDDQQAAPPAAQAPPAPEPPQTAPTPKPKPAAAKKKPSPKAARRATRHEPTHGEAAAIRAKDHPSGPSIEVAQPWDHYDSMTEDQVLDKLTGADPTLRAMVRLYESQHGGRRQILLATEEVTAEP
jgi:hypothetical protein